MKRLLSAIGVVIASVVLALPASADGPVRTTSPFGGPYDDPTGCPTFGTTFWAATDKDVIKTFSENGVPVRAIATGSLKLFFQNDVTKKTIVVNVSGPGTFTYNADGTSTLVMRGLNAGYFGDLITAGQITVTIAADGVTILSSSTIHHSTSLCAALS